MRYDSLGLPFTHRDLHLGHATLLWLTPLTWILHTNIYIQSCNKDTRHTCTESADKVSATIQKTQWITWNCDDVVCRFVDLCIVFFFWIYYLTAELSIRMLLTFFPVNLIRCAGQLNPNYIKCQLRVAIPSTPRRAWSVEHGAWPRAYVERVHVSSTAKTSLLAGSSNSCWSAPISCPQVAPISQIASIQRACSCR